MKAEIITIGDEILIGQIIDTNSAWMASRLNLIGIEIHRITSISDNKKDIFKAIDKAKADVDIIFITGGLGPTNDDITKESLAEYFDAKLIENNIVLNHIEQLVLKRNSSMNERNVRQALVPDNCEVIHNKMGTAPGMLFKQNGKIIISMPGVPFEMKEMMNNKILPLLSQQKNDFVIIHKNVLIQGVSESKLAENLEKWEGSLAKEISLAYLPSPGIIKLRLTARGKNKVDLVRLIDSNIEKLESIIPDLICGYDFETLEEIVGKLLKDSKLTLSLAESCTGGNISKLITSISGSSSYYLGGVIAYANEIKENILNVKSSKINNYGAVSKEVVEEMAIGVRNLYKTDFSIATSGIAGPTGGTKEKPVGTIWIAVSSKTKVISKQYIFGDQRETNIQRASVTALNMLQKLMLGKEI